MKGLYFLSVVILCCVACASAALPTQKRNPLNRALATESGDLVYFEDDFHEHQKFVNWVKKAAEHKHDISGCFKDEHVPDVHSLEEMGEHLKKEHPELYYATSKSVEEQFKLNFAIDPSCLESKEKYWYRQEDGTCNWLRKGEAAIGSYQYPRMRDFNQTEFADGYNSPREGPNAREVSNAFFKRKTRLHYDHTAVLLGLIEFVMHDVSFSQDSADETLLVPIPKGDPAYDAQGLGNASFTVRRTIKQPGSGIPGVPRQNPNMATSWLDLSALYGNNATQTNALRSGVDGKLKATVEGGKEYLPFNTLGLPMNTRPGQRQQDLFAGGDPRTNEDWLLLSIHTLLLREHNRLCTIMRKQEPTWDDERIFQTVRLVMSSKFMLIANAYQMTYWDNMPWPTDDGFPLYRQMFGKGIGEINPYHTYPWHMTTRKNGQPMIASQEMAMVYRFHELIIDQVPIIYGNGTVQAKELITTGFDAKGFLSTGIDNVLRGMANATIPNFKSGVDESFRSAGGYKDQQYRGHKFDIATWSVVHEREQGLPTFNQYFAEFMAQTPAPSPAAAVYPRKTFEEFSSDPEAVANLKRLYKSPDEVDLVVGTQLDEQYFPGTTVPRSALIVSLFSLFGLGNSDRFQPGYAISRCLLVDTPIDCHPTNALEDLLWRPTDPKVPHVRWFNTFWVAEMDFQGHGRNLLWRIITENSDVKCLQRDPLFPFDSKSNPILCQLPPPTLWDNIKSYGEIALTVLSIGLDYVLDLVDRYWIAVVIALVVVIITVVLRSCAGKKSAASPTKASTKAPTKKLTATANNSTAATKAPARKKGVARGKKPKAA